jgi:hypothetical protein
MTIDLAIEQARTWLNGTLPIDLCDVLTALLAEIEQLRRPRPAGEVIRCAQVDVRRFATHDCEPVQLIFTSGATPFEAVAAFLRDAADELGLELVPASHLLYGLADQLDPPVTAVVDDAAPGGLT